MKKKEVGKRNKKVKTQDEYWLIFFKYFLNKNRLKRKQRLEIKRPLIR